MEIHTKIDAQSENFKILEIHENRVIFWGDVLKPEGKEETESQLFSISGQHVHKDHEVR